MPIQHREMRAKKNSIDKKGSGKKFQSNEKKVVSSKAGDMNKRCSFFVSLLVTFFSSFFFHFEDFFVLRQQVVCHILIKSESIVKLSEHALY